MSGEMSSDGAGGKKAVPQVLRQVGSGADAVHTTGPMDNSEVASFGMVLGGIAGKQTVPRAAARGALLALEKGMHILPDFSCKIQIVPRSKASHGFR